jgi:hypothetical protein
MADVVVAVKTEPNCPKRNMMISNPEQAPALFVPSEANRDYMNRLSYREKAMVIAMAHTGART